MKINIGELSKELYKIHLNRKNFRICNTLRTYILRDDFELFLKEIEDKTISSTEIINNIGNKNIFFELEDIKAQILIDKYINKVIQSDFFKDKDEKYIDYFSTISQNLLKETYTDGLVSLKNKKSFFAGHIVIDDDVNYPNIKNNIYIEEPFTKVFNEIIMSQIDNINSDKNSMLNINMGSHQIADISTDETYQFNKPKICQLVFDDTTEKQELINYIDKKWDAIVWELKSSKPKKKGVRLSAPSNFLRDIEIYNKYHEFKNNELKNPDVKTWSWLLKITNNKIEIEPNTIRKIVSLLRSELKKINSDG